MLCDETIGLSRLAAARANPTTRDLVIVSTDRKHLDIAVNCVANLANVGIREYIVLADTAKTCEALRGRLACVVHPAYAILGAEAGATARRTSGYRGRSAGRLAELGYNPMVLDSDSALFANPLALVATHLPEYAFVALADHSGTWACSTAARTTCATRARRPLLAAWRNFERRVRHPQHVGAATGVDDELRRAARLPTGEAAAAGEYADGTFAGRRRRPRLQPRRTNDGRVPRTEKAWMC